MSGSRHAKRRWKMLELPSKSEFVVVEPTNDRLELHTPRKLWWPGVLLMVAVAILFVYLLLNHEVYFREGWIQQLSGGVQALFLESIFAALTIWRSIHEWLRVADGSIEIQTRIWNWTLTSKKARLSNIRRIDCGSHESETDASDWVVMETEHWDLNFGNGTGGRAILALVRELQRLNASSS